MLVHSQMISALDAAALAVGSTKGLTQQQMQSLAQQYFNANFTADPSFGTPDARRRYGSEPDGGSELLGSDADRPDECGWH